MIAECRECGDTFDPDAWDECACGSDDFVILEDDEDED